MSEDPWYATCYAGFRNNQLSAEHTWANSPYRDYGILLACEVAGAGNIIKHADDFPDYPSVIHVVPSVDSVTVRYVFLVPPHSGVLQEKHFTHLVPTRRMVKGPMMKVFGKFRERTKQETSQEDEQERPSKRRRQGSSTTTVKGGMAQIYERFGIALTTKHQVGRR